MVLVWAMMTTMTAAARTAVRVVESGCTVGARWETTTEGALPRKVGWAGRYCLCCCCCCCCCCGGDSGMGEVLPVKEEEEMAAARKVLRCCASEAPP